LFTSKLYIPAKLTSKADITHEGTKVEFSENRNFTLVSNKYSPDQKMMEFVIEFENTNFDGIDNYYFVSSIVGGNPKRIVTKEIISDSLITVVRVTNVRKFDEFSLLFAPKKGKVDEIKDQDTGEIIINKYNRREVLHIDIGKTETAYLIERMEASISNLEEQLAKKEETLKKYGKQFDSLNKENEDLDRNSKYYTESEADDARIKQSENNVTILEVQEKIEKLKKSIDELKLELNDAQRKKQNLKKE